MRRYDGLSEYRKVAQHRLHDAQELLMEPTLELEAGIRDRRHLRGAMYLAGYSVECILKAYIISCSGEHRTLAEIAPEFTGNAGHSLDRLLLRSGLEGDLGVHLADWQLCRTWTPDWRYSPDVPSRGEAMSFVAASQRVHAWIRSRVF
jgi:hypothetical protein